MKKYKQSIIIWLPFLVEVSKCVRIMKCRNAAVENRSASAKLSSAAVCISIVLLAVRTVSGATVIVSDEPDVVARAAAREAARQDTTWTSENIQAHPYLFIQDQIRKCDQLKAKIEAQKISLVRMGKQAVRTVEESDGAITRYTNFLASAKNAYKRAKKENKWPVIVNGFELDEEQLCDRIADALDRIELAKKEKVDSEAISKKVSIRQGILKSKSRELQSTRLKLVQQGEQVKMNSELAKIGELTTMLGVIKDMMLEIDEDPTKLSIDDLTSDDPDAMTKRKVRAFLDQ